MKVYINDVRRASGILELMLAARIVIVAAVLLGQAFASDPIPREEYRARRSQLAAGLHDGVTVLFGRGRQEGDSLRSGFLQEPNFLYLTGWREPDAILMFTPTAGETLFLPSRDAQKEHYYGRTASPSDPGVAAAIGFRRVLPVERFESLLHEAVAPRGKLYTLANSPSAGRLRALLPGQDTVDVAEVIGRMRLKKSAFEVEAIRRSLQATAAAHLDAWRRIRPGVFEYQAAASVVGSYLERGCERSAYAPSVASGPSAITLHYAANRRRMESGDLVLIDAGAECDGYASDLTRTIPVSGRFTPRQLELYNAVLGAQRAVLNAVKPGMHLRKDAPRSLTRIAQDHLDAHGKDQTGKPLGQHLAHVVGHHVGLEVHDAGSLTTSGPLEPGMVVAIEVGVYIEEEGVGIRIEDMVVVTEQGAILLANALPKAPTAIEKALAR